MPRPWQTYPEHLVDEALQRALAPAQLLRELTPPNLFPPRFGYRQDSLTVRDVMGLGRYRVPSQMEQLFRANWAGGASAEINAGARNSGGGVSV